MRIRSMTATFGKLENAVLSLEPGLNVLEGPNEWGKSTWCAFLTAMLYGIDTRSHSTKTVLADKERYAPWSGSPMEGRLEVTWKERNITIERRSRGRIPFGVFRAYETETGLELPELTAANCGQVLLGVEKSVFLRSSFLRMSDLPVTQDEALRRRLNALVTTGEESGPAEALAQKLRELKNRCRLNRSTGLLPQAQAKCRELEENLSELLSLRDQAQRQKQRLEELEQHRALLENHRAALEFEAAQDYNQKLSQAQTAQAQARQALSLREAACKNHPPLEDVEQALVRLEQLRDTRQALLLEQQMLSPAPENWAPPAVFRDLEPEQALAQAESDDMNYRKNSRKGPFPWYWLLLSLFGIAVALLIPQWFAKALGAAAVLASFVLFAVSQSRNRKRQHTAQALLDRYAPLPPDQWISAARSYGEKLTRMRDAQNRCREDREALNTRLAVLNRELESLSVRDWAAYRQDYALLSEASRDYRRAAELAQALESAHRESDAPAFPDTMTYSAQETARLLSDCAQQQRQLQLKLGTVLGRMEAMDTEDSLRHQLETEQNRVQELEDTCAALELALDTLAQASAQLQRRFAPAISSRAQALFCRLTEGRYDRLSLSEDLSLTAGAQSEATLRSPLWRSDGTADQLYLALRLALSETLAPDAPLILDDALVRFDDHRLQTALEVLQELSQTRQILLFTCQSRESRLLSQ